MLLCVERGAKGCLARPECAVAGAGLSFDAVVARPARRLWIGGHRGAPAEGLVENTLPSLLRALDDGADFVEIDVRLTADGELVLVHDADLGRIAGRSDVLVEESTGAAVRHAAPFVPTLAEVFAALPPAFPINIELKRDQASVPALAAAAASLGRSSVLISSFDWDLLAEVRRRAPSLPLALLADDAGAVAGLAAAGRHLRPWSWHVAAALASADLVRAAPVPVLAYTVNETALAGRLSERGVAGIFTDAPGSFDR